MRLDVSIFGILASLTGLVAADGDDSRGSGDSGGTATISSSSNMIISMDALPTPAVFTPSKGNRTFHYVREPGIIELEVTAVFLRRYEDDVMIGTGDLEGLSGSTGSNTSAEISEEVILRRQAGPAPLPPLHFNVTHDTVNLPISADLSEYSINIGQPLYYEFVWENSTFSGSSFSQLIAVTTDAGFTDAYNALQNTNMGTSPAKPETLTASSSDTTPATATTTAVSTSPTSSVEAAAHVSSSSGGLATGAIAGIAVGCSVAGLLIIAFIVWFFFFRRRSTRERVRGADFAADSGTRSMMHDKEAAAAGISESSPHSTYADDGGRLHDPRRRSMPPGGGGGATDDTGSYAPYSDRAQSPSPPGAVGAAAGAGSQTDLHTTTTTRSVTPPFNTRYAHLIEEGMTEDEIRRLEEEERHLDAAIEDAGRASRMTHQS
ncbi:hypothetical protein F4677DRAFT_287572 [Hypoxylon crocopeplum]|nr:hypothetical protein F4677DRAFT_287572 [Hypoxylon crocopeplum]